MGVPRLRCQLGAWAAGVVGIIDYTHQVWPRELCFFNSDISIFLTPVFRISPPRSLPIAQANPSQPNPAVPTATNTQPITPSNPSAA
jgi:hypothetical protein